MKTKTMIAFIIALVAIAQVQVTFAQKADKTFDGWTLLGTRIVDYTLDRDVVSLKESKNSVTGLKFVVKKWHTEYAQSNCAFYKWRYTRH